MHIFKSPTIDQAPNHISCMHRDDPTEKMIKFFIDLYIIVVVVSYIFWLEGVYGRINWKGIIFYVILWDRRSTDQRREIKLN